MRGSVRISAAIVGMALMSVPGFADNRAESARKWVQGFYTWYAKKCEGSFGVGDAIKARPLSFSPAFRRAIAEDEAESARHKGEIVGLDFDPIVNAQDFAARYEAGQATSKGDRYLVRVFGVWNGKKNSIPDVVPEVRRVNGRWRFEDFHYGRDPNKPDETFSHMMDELRREWRKNARSSGRKR